MDIIKKTLANTSGVASIALCLAYLFIGFCFIVMANIGFDELTDLEVSGIIFFPLCVFLCRIPFIDVVIMCLSMYGGYITQDKSTFALIVFILQCVFCAPLIVAQIFLYFLAMVNIIKNAP